MAMSLPRDTNYDLKEKVLRRPWLCLFELAYDGGGEAWIGYYRTKFGARMSMLWHYYVASWGGSAKVIQNEWPGRKYPN